MDTLNIKFFCSFLLHVLSAKLKNKQKHVLVTNSSVLPQIQVLEKWTVSRKVLEYFLLGSATTVGVMLAIACCLEAQSKFKTVKKYIASFRSKKNSVNESN